jgi:hypothetical protein
MTFKISAEKFQEDCISSMDKENAKAIFSIFNGAVTAINYPFLVKIFQEESNYDLNLFLREMKSKDNGLKTRLAKKISLRFHLSKSGIEEETIINILERVLDYYYDIFISGMTTNEGQQQLLNIALSNSKLITKTHDEAIESIKLIESIYNELIVIREKIKTENEKQQKKRSGFQILDQQFWDDTRSKTDKKNLSNFLIRTDSMPHFLKEVVASNYYIKNKKMRGLFTDHLNECIESNNRYCLIKILSKGGEGKSTFLLDLAKIFYKKYVIIFFDGIQKEHISNIINSLLDLKEYFNPELPILILIDNPASYEYLTDLKDNLFETLHDRQLIFVVTERSFRYLTMENLSKFETGFYIKKHLEYQSNTIRSKIAKSFIDALPQSDRINKTQLSLIENAFRDDYRKSIAENIYDSIFYLKEKHLIVYSFDWEDWFDYVKTNNKSFNWESLFTFISIFYQFGYRPKRSFCCSFLNIDDIELSTELDDNKNLPIYSSGDYLLLRHEQMAQWYLKQKKAEKSAMALFKKYLKSIDSIFAKDLFIWMSKNPEFKESTLFNVLSPQNSSNNFNKDVILNNYKINLLENYLSKEFFKNDYKAYTELGIVYREQKKYAKAEEVLLEANRIDSKHVHSRTELGIVYREQKKYAKSGGSSFRRS